MRPISFHNAKSDFELLDLIRMRYQMYAGDLRTLAGILLGFSMAKSEYETNLDEFSRHLTESKDVNPHAVSWVKVITREAEQPEYEIPLFFDYLDKFRNIDHEVLGSVELSAEQRHFDFQRSARIMSVDYPKLPLKPPHRLQAVKIPGHSVHAFYFDELGQKYFEQCLREFDYLKKWAKECFDIDPEQWQ